MNASVRKGSAARIGEESNETEGNNGHKGTSSGISGNELSNGDALETPAADPDKYSPSVDFQQAVDFQWRILPRVSRTFALTIPQLPQPLDLIVGNAYLWCRVADTIEDEPNVPRERKPELHDSLIAVLDGRLNAADWGRRAGAELTRATVAAERQLVGEIGQLVAVTRSLSEIQRRAIRDCLNKMCSGMTQFEMNASTAGLADMDELSRYCYYVAGVVGEMLTTLFCDHSPAVAARKEDLDRLATSFGQGLQMTNILKDVFEDYKQGRCWLPRKTFRSYGCELIDLDLDRDRTGFNEALREMVAVAHGHLRNALDYALTIPREQDGIRRFCLWSLGLAILTLRKVTQHPDFRSAEEVKVSRATVAGTIASTNLFIHHDRPFRLLFNLAARGVPCVAVAPGGGTDLLESRLAN